MPDYACIYWTNTLILETKNYNILNIINITWVRHKNNHAHHHPHTHKNHPHKLNVCDIPFSKHCRIEIRESSFSHQILQVICNMKCLKPFPQNSCDIQEQNRISDIQSHNTHIEYLIFNHILHTQNIYIQSHITHIEYLIFNHIIHTQNI